MTGASWLLSVANKWCTRVLVLLKKHVPRGLGPRPPCNTVESQGGEGPGGRVTCDLTPSPQPEVLDYPATL